VGKRKTAKFTALCRFLDDVILVLLFSFRLIQWIDSDSSELLLPGQLPWSEMYSVDAFKTVLKCCCSKNSTWKCNPV
jgi:hypothetical protein